MKPSGVWLGISVVAVVALSAVAWRFAFFVLPLAWTGEARLLAEALGLRPGMCVADVGAGDGRMAEAMAAVVGEGGRVIATEISADRLADLAARKSRRSLANVEVVAAGDDITGLEDARCDALYLRHVFHHLDDRPAMARQLARAVRPEGRIAVVDFPPGALWFHGTTHGVSADDVAAAFAAAGWRVRERRDDWGGGTFLVVVERDDPAPVTD